jgi:hypothetical protein
MAGIEKGFFRLTNISQRPSTAGHDRPLCGDEYGGMKVCNVLLI